MIDVEGFSGVNEGADIKKDIFLLQIYDRHLTYNEVGKCTFLEGRHYSTQIARGSRRNISKGNKQPEK